MDFSRLTKLEKQSLEPGNVDPDQKLSAIVKVKKDGYLPAKVNLRQWISDRILTADFLAGDLPDIEADPQVESISPATKLPLQKLPT